MRIALVTDCYLPQVGGIEMQVAQLALHLKAAGHDPQVITPTPGPAEIDGIPITRLDASMLPWRIPASPKTFRALVSLCVCCHVSRAVIGPADRCDLALHLVEGRHSVRRFRSHVPLE